MVRLRPYRSLRTAFAARLLPLVAPDSFDTSMSRPGSLPSRGGVSRVCVGRPCSRSAAPCCRQGAPAHVRDVLSEPGRTRIMRNPGLQLLEDLVQPSIWTVCGKQHRQVDQAPGVSGPFELWIIEPLAQRRVGEMVN